jgi:hypothetical protein
MRRLKLPISLTATALALAACSYYYSVTESFDADPVMLDDVETEARYQIKICWEGKGEPDGIDLKVFATTSEANTGRASVGIEDNSQPITAERLDPADTPVMRWSPYDVVATEACTVGVEVVFLLEEPDAGAIEITWDLEVEAWSDGDEEVENLDLSATIEKL